MENSRSVFLESIKNFPRWMDIRKRPFTSIGGHFLRSIIEELDDIQQSLTDFKNEFFILTYVGREHTIIDYIYIAQVGDITNEFKIIEPEIEITENPRIFLNNEKPVTLYQNGYLLFHSEHIPNRKVIYSINDYKYSIDVVKFHVWNIIDEFATFSSLERFDEEDNAQLLKRCLLSFKNPTNSTEQGIKNAIINSVSNYVSLSNEDITIETPNEFNLSLFDSDFDTIYERLAQFNQDIFRTKRWNMGYWEHGFKKLAYVPHQWDTVIETYQDGVGQNDSLQAILTNKINEEETTDVSITGYQKSEIMINEYIRNCNIEENIDLTLKKYDNILKPKTIEYKIIASDVKKIQDKDIIINSYKKSEGESEHYIDDLAISNRGATIKQRNQLAANSKYKIKFYPKSNYSDMLINKANITYDNGLNIESLLIEDNVYKNKNNIFQNTDVAFHGSSVKNFKTFLNIIDTKNGVTINDESAVGSFTVDITGMAGKILKIGHECKSVDITKNPSFVSYNNFTLTEDGNLEATNTDSNSSITIELDCNSISWELATATDPSAQGSCTVLFFTDGKIEPSLSGLWTSGRKLSKIFDKLTNIKVQIQKSGMNPITIKNISASRYEINYRVSKGNMIITPFSNMLPVISNSENNTLTVEIKSYSAFAPIINYVHIGSVLTNACYVSPEITTNQNPAIIDISSNCIVKLYEIENGNETLLNDNLITKPIYTNNSSSEVVVVIDTSKFTNISRSNPVIEKTTENGSIVNYITLKPGESFDTITIEGSSLILVDSSTLDKIICPNMTDYNIYISKAVKGFVVQELIKDKETIVHLTRDKLNGMADVFSFQNLPQNVTGCFLIDKINNMESIVKSFENTFEEVYLIPNDTNEYIAYNKATVFMPEVKGIQIVDTFAPLIPPNKLMIYSISNIDNQNAEIANVTFEKSGSVYDYWSLGKKSYGLCINVDMDYDNSDSYELDIKQLTQTFIMSNSIELDTEYEVEGNVIELARYIINPPDNMKIIYESMDYGEEIIVEEDGFNKLYFSNVEEIKYITINGNIISPLSYELLNEEGIIIWNTDIYYGDKAQIFCSYKNPKYLSFKSIESLYELAGYSVNAYRTINAIPITLNDLTDGETRVLNFGENIYPDKTVVHCTNPSFQAKVESNNVLRVNRMNTNNVIALKTGYYYDQGKEYYLFNYLHTEKIDKMSNVDLYNVKRLDNSLLFIQESTNYLRDSAMRKNQLHELLNIDFVNNKNIQGLSKINSLTACDTYNCWDDFKMDINFDSGENGQALMFNANSDDAYAIMDITRFVNTNTLITLSATGTLIVKIAKEIKNNDISYSKSLFVQPYSVFKQNEAYYQFIFDETTDLNSKFYLLLTGTGILDDIVVKDYVPQETPSSIHKKNINAIGLLIDESQPKLSKHRFIFDINGNKLNGTELDNNGKLQIGSNIDWGLTKIYDVRGNINSCVITDLKVEKDMAIYSQGKPGTIITPAIYLSNKKSIKSLIAKINDVVMDKFKDFKITVLTGNSKDGQFNEVISDDKTNTVKVFQNRLMSYVKIKVEMPTERVINNIEVFAEYAETTDSLHIKINSSGDLITKVFDTGYLANFKPIKIEAIDVNCPDKIRILIRGCRENESTSVWSSWKNIKLDENLNAIGDPIVFDNYRLFQFKICLDSKDAELLIDNFVLEVV